jgi:hypothetical protein
MPSKAPTVEQVDQSFQTRLKSLPSASVLADANEYDEVFRSLMRPDWQDSGDGVQHIEANPNTVLFRVATECMIPNDGSLSFETVEGQFGKIADTVLSLCAAVASIRIYFDKLVVSDVSFGRKVELKARGIIKVSTGQ